jgi:hypothetical protein
VNAVRLAGRIGLTPDRTVGPSHVVNGDKILPIAGLSRVSEPTLRWRYRMGAGLGALELACEPAAPRRAATASRHRRPLTLVPGSGIVAGWSLPNG